jgi:hypothetical protein
MSRRRVVCVIGMHRSGTSLVTRVLNLVGLDLGPEAHLMGPSRANQTGHWESVPISDLNDEILARLGGTWSEPPRLPPGWERSPDLAKPRKQARELIESDFADAKLWGFKDPRASLTAPFWQRIIGRMDYVICLRNPMDVAASLAARRSEPVPFGQGVDLWLTYTRSALAATAGHRREFVFYEDLMADPDPVVMRLAKFIGREAEAEKPEARAAVGVALSQGLWHHRSKVSDVVDAPQLAFHLKSIYVALRQFVPGSEAVGAETLDILAAYADRAGSRLADLEAASTELDRVRQRSRELERELTQRSAAAEADLTAAQAEVDGMKDALSEERRLRRVADAELRAVRLDLKEAHDELPQVATARAEGRGEPARRQEPHDRLVADVRARAREVIPSGATVLVAGKGDDALLELDDNRAWHFPAGPDGRYLGYHPGGDTAAIAQLEVQRARGGDHLLLPATTLWWLKHYQGLRRHLDARYTLLSRDERCAIYRLKGDGRQAGGPLATLRSAVASLRVRSGRDPSVLDWHSGLDLAKHLPELSVFSPPGDDVALPYLADTIDVVLVGSLDDARVAEARRVATEAVVMFDRDHPDQTELEWMTDGLSWGGDVSVTVLPDSRGSLWDETFTALGETVGDGFAGELNAAAPAPELEAVSERVAALGMRMRPIETAAESGLGQRARVAAKTSDRAVQVFVTAPTIPLPDWLPSIVSLFSRDPDAGVVGARILGRDGALEEAGGIVEPGARLRRGSGDPNPDRPEYSFVRPVDFCSPPVLATKRELFERLSGFGDGDLAPAEAVVDYSLRAGDAGKVVYYQPDARVVAIGAGG